MIVTASCTKRHTEAARPPPLETSHCPVLALVPVKTCGGHDDATGGVRGCRRTSPALLALREATGGRRVPAAATLATSASRASSLLAKSSTCAFGGQGAP